jgi:Bacterial extracellular solute-binding protein
MKLPHRRQFLHLAAGATALPVNPRIATAQQSAPAQTLFEPLVWPIVANVRPEVRAFAGHTNTVPDIVGRFGAPARLVIFTEGNHLMVLHGEDILAAFPRWAKSHNQYADLDLDNIVLLTLPQPIVIQTIRTGALALGNLILDFSRSSGYYPDIVMGGPAPLRALRGLGVIEPQARVFSKNRGRALLVRKGNPLGINGLADVARTGARLAQADQVEAAVRSGNIAFVEALIGKFNSAAVFAHEVEHFPGRLGITHRDVPEAVARGYADVGLTQYHLISYWVRTFPNHFELVPIAGAERFPVSIGFARVVDPLRPRALKAFEEFFFGRARDLYPHYDFARMTDEEYGAAMALE